MIFDPHPQRKFFETCGLALILDTQFEKDAPMGNIAKNRISDVILACLIGLGTQATPIIPRCLEWLDTAISHDEDFGTSRNFHRMALHWAKALGLWINDGLNRVEIWNKVRQFDEAALMQDQNVWPKNLIAKDRLDDYMAFCYQAEQYEVGVAEFEKYYGLKTMSLKRTLKPREFAYILCLNKLNYKFNDATLFEAGRNMLQANLEENWLGRGQYIRAATWLKLVHWEHNKTLLPFEVLLRAYDDMPNVARPEFVNG
ncbi:hypothetical protein EDC30_11912 [Paucimonas lemoignei]|uniref:Uncharacterized protein n=1 Tax=Paucimonas lemoignei TaxID=29443 RepID=A0A4R3HQU1_PAULE|nr:hypothetical protein [Paucimonas lemoignei]TCS32901.1 hypothetical protein EDC30_11912 [Paucimonas lemoignei]